jgi:hypothetical protein
MSPRTHEAAVMFAPVAWSSASWRCTSSPTPARSARVKRAVELLEQDGGVLSSGERTMILAAWAIWSSHGPTLRFDALLGLDTANTEALCSLLVAVRQGPAAIDAWIARPEARRFRPAT